MSSINQSRINDIIKMVANQNEIPFADAEKVVLSIFGSVSSIMSDGCENVIYLRYFGTFGGKRSRKLAIQRNKDRKLQKKLNDAKL